MSLPPPPTKTTRQHHYGHPSEHPLVLATTDGEPYVYEFTFFSVIELMFGFFDGAINAMPKGGYMSECGEALKG